MKGQFGPNGALFDGWESRRHNPTYDWSVTYFDGLLCSETDEMKRAGPSSSSARWARLSDAMSIRVTSAVTSASACLLLRAVVVLLICVLAQVARERSLGRARSGGRDHLGGFDKG